MLLKALAAINQELLSCQGNKAIGWHAMQKLRLKQSEIRDELRAHEVLQRRQVFCLCLFSPWVMCKLTQLPARQDLETCSLCSLQIDWFDLAEAEEGVEQESAEALTEVRR